MTCIVGMIEKGKGYIAADSMGSNGSTKDYYERPKVFKKGDFLIGYTSSYRMGQLLEHKLVMPALKKGQLTDAYIMVDFVDAVRQLLKDNGYSKVESNRESTGTFMFIYDGRLFIMEDDLAVLESKHGFDACGSGVNHAKAALYALRNSDLNPEDKLKEAINTAAEFVCTVGGPVDVLVK